MHFETAYSDNAALREKLYPLFENVFGIPIVLFEDFYRRGFWDPTYCPYTYFKDDAAVANASRFALPLMIEGQAMMVAGIQSVMTLPAYRHQGLMSRLMDRLLEDVDARYPLSLLFTENPSLYQKFGFRVVPEKRFRAPISVQVEHTYPSLRRLDPLRLEDAALLDDLLRRSTPLSYRFSPTIYSSSFHLNFYEDKWKHRLYYHADWNVVLIFEADAHTLCLYGILAYEFPTMADIVQAVGATNLSWVITDFCPDRFGDWDWNSIPHESSLNLMVRGTVNLPCAFKYPEIAIF